MGQKRMANGEKIKMPSSPYKYIATYFVRIGEANDLFPNGYK